MLGPWRPQLWRRAAGPGDRDPGALGASARDVFGLIVGSGVRLVLAGVGISSMLVGVTAHDGTTYAGVIIVLVVVAVLASYIPARRATRVDPLAAVRSE